jgi:hypothetical protein
VRVGGAALARGREGDSGVAHRLGRPRHASRCDEEPQPGCALERPGVLGRPSLPRRRTRAHHVRSPAPHAMGDRAGSGSQRRRPRERRGDPGAPPRHPQPVSACSVTGGDQPAVLNRIELSVSTSCATTRRPAEAVDTAVAQPAGTPRRCGPTAPAEPAPHQRTRAPRLGDGKAAQGRKIHFPGPSGPCSGTAT